MTRKEKKDDSFKEEPADSFSSSPRPPGLRRGQLPGEADPGVISEGESEDEFTVSKWSTW